MVSFYKKIAWIMAAVLTCTLLAIPAGAQTDDAEEPVVNGSFFDIMEQGEFTEQTVLLEGEKVLQVEAEVSVLGCQLARFILSEDGTTLLRIEYYDAEGQLVFLSEVQDYDIASKSYTELIYFVDETADVQTLLRTDTYAEGELREQVVHAEMPTVNASVKQEKAAEPSSQPAQAPATPKATEPAQTPTIQKTTESAPAATTPKVTESAPAATTPKATESAPAATTPKATEPAPAPTTAPKATEPAPAPTSAPTEPPKPEITYDRTTSIYTDDKETLLRVEYYNSENQLTHYSSVEDYDNNTKSYTEKIYRYDWDTDTEILERTDVYVNGQLQGGNP